MKARNTIKRRTETKNKNQEPRQRRKYCFFHRENKGHITRDCPDVKKTHERIKSRENPQPLAQ
jgi:hypothetical protein